MAKSRLKEKKSKKRLQVKKTSLFWVYFVFGGLIILLSLFFAPFWKEISEKIPWGDWYSYALGGMVAATILVYMFTVLLKKLKNKDLNKNVRIIFGVEFSLMAFFAICSVVKAILNDNEKFDFLNACQIIGLALWLRGVVEMFNAYYYDRKSKQSYPIWYLAINIALITFGPLVFSIGIIYRTTIDLIVSYAFCSIIFVLGVFCCVWGGLSKPIKIKEEPIEEVQLIESNQEETKLVEQSDVQLVEQEVKKEEKTNDEVVIKEENDDEVVVKQDNQEVVENSSDEVVIEEVEFNKDK